MTPVFNNSDIQENKQQPPNTGNPARAQIQAEGALHMTPLDYS